jgi:hypothetical protein
MLSLKIPLDSLIFKYGYFNESKFYLNTIPLKSTLCKTAGDVF